MSLKSPIISNWKIWKERYRGCRVRSGQRILPLFLAAPVFSIFQPGKKLRTSFLKMVNLLPKDCSERCHINTQKITQTAEPLQISGMWEWKTDLAKQKGGGGGKEIQGPSVSWKVIKNDIIARQATWILSFPLVDYLNVALNLEVRADISLFSEYF